MLCSEATIIIVTYYIFCSFYGGISTALQKKPTAVGDESTMVDPSLLHYKAPTSTTPCPHRANEPGYGSMVGGWRKGSGEPGQTMGEQLPAAGPPPIRGGEVG